MSERRTGGGEDRWDAPDEAQRAERRARVHSEAAVTAQGGGVKMKWIFVWLIASAFAVLVLRNIHVVERFESGLIQEREEGMTLSKDDDLDKASDEAEDKKSGYDGPPPSAAGPPPLSHEASEMIEKANQY
jgi:hypothetical protein